MRHKSTKRFIITILFIFLLLIIIIVIKKLSINGINDDTSEYKLSLASLCPYQESYTDQLTIECWDLEFDLISTGLSFPTEIAHHPHNSKILYIAEKEGRIRILENDNLQDTPFLDISDKVGSDGVEQGLLGLTFHPDYNQNGYFFVNYTNNSGATTISRFSIDSLNQNIAIKESELILMTIDQPDKIHNGGHIEFGGDGYLYIGTGDGGPSWHAQNGDSLLGKLLRIDVNHKEGYSIPNHNPFTANRNFRNEIWSFGLRNPWKFSFDQKTNDLYIGDVGLKNFEEINFQPSSSTGAENYGWLHYEGDICVSELSYNNERYQDRFGWMIDFEKVDCSDASPELNNGKLTFPIYQYKQQVTDVHNHEEQSDTEYHTHQEDICSGSAIIAGEVYRGQNYPYLDGIFIFGDFCGSIYGMEKDSYGNWIVVQLLTENDMTISSFGRNVDGEIFLAEYIKGHIYQLKSTMRYN